MKISLGGAAKRCFFTLCHPPLKYYLTFFQKPLDKRYFAVYNIWVILRQQVSVKAMAFLPR